MPTDEHAALRDDDGRSALCFERVLAHPPGRVWRALTVPDELFDWHPTPFAGRRVPDGWSELNREYEARFAIPAEAATPPPAELPQQPTPGHEPRAAAP